MLSAPIARCWRARTPGGSITSAAANSVRSGDIFERLVQLTGRTSGVIEHSPGRRQHPIADISRIMADTAWSPRIPLEQTLVDTLAYFQSLRQ